MRREAAIVTVESLSDLEFSESHSTWVPAVNGNGYASWLLDCLASTYTATTQ